MCEGTGSVIVVPEGIEQECGEGYPEQCRREHPALLDATADWKRFGRVRAVYVFILGLDNSKQFRRATNLLQDVKQGQRSFYF